MNEFKVPILPHLKKFIIAQLYNGQEEPIKVVEDSLLGRHIMSILIDKRNVTGSGAVGFMDKEYTSTLRLQLSSQMMKRSPRINKLARLNLELGEIFRQSLFVWVTCAKSYGIAAFPAVQHFLEEYGIEESEYSKDAAYKAWQRYQNLERTKEKSNLVTDEAK